MSTTTAPPPHLNGNGVVPPEVLREADFLQKLLQIRDEVFDSKHPRIRLPAKIVGQVAPRSSQATSSRPTINGTSNGVASSLLPPRTETSSQHFFPPVTATPRPFSAKSSSSSIDPVLLTKSEHLIKAELQLKRQQIERTLKDQFDRKGRGNDNDEREALINVEECLQQALLLVPAFSGLQSTNNSDDVESFDENSYYSSKADSWSSDEVDANADAPTALTSQLSLPAKQVSAHAGTQPTVIDLDEEPYEPVDDIEIYEPESGFLEDAEEEDYSPPPAEAGPADSQRSRGRPRGFNSSTNGSRRQSPYGPAPAIQNPRKRRREEKRDGKRRQQQARARAIPSPEPYIKEEPESPPPFATYQEPQPNKRRALPPYEMEAISAPESARTQPVYYREQEPLTRLHREYDEPSSPTVIHAPQLRAYRGDPDLRRVASLQYARRPNSPSNGSDVFAAPVPRPVRAASHAFVQRQEQPVYREVSSRPSVAPRYVRDRSRSPVQEYVSRQQSPMLMAPPPRRIVVDQYGNKFYAAPVELREPMAPPSRRMEVDPYFERASTREPTMRAPVRAEMYEDEPVHMMPPPPRRYVGGVDADLMESPVYRQRAVSRRPVEVEYRPAPQYEDMGPSREYLPSRAYSMRPEVVRQEVPTGFSRHESVQPVRVTQPRYREVSIVQQEPYGERRYVSAAPQGRRYVEEEPIETVHDPYAAQPQRTFTRY